jgi:hypothetical protein
MFCLFLLELLFALLFPASLLFLMLGSALLELGLTCGGFLFRLSLRPGAIVGAGLAAASAAACGSCTEQCLSVQTVSLRPSCLP